MRPLLGLGATSARRVGRLSLALGLALVVSTGPAGAADRSAPPARPAASSDRGARRPASEVWRRTELFFGLSRKGGPDVTEEEFARFLREVVTPRFPDGLTVLAGDGQYRTSANVIVRERSKVLVLLYERADRGASARIEEIRRAYSSAFDQESVLRADSRARVSS